MFRLDVSEGRLRELENQQQEIIYNIDFRDNRKYEKVVKIQKREYEKV